MGQLSASVVHQLNQPLTAILEEIKIVFSAFWTPRSRAPVSASRSVDRFAKAHRRTLRASNNADGRATFCARWPLLLSS